MEEIRNCAARSMAFKEAFFTGQQGKERNSFSWWETCPVSVMETAKTTWRIQAKKKKHFLWDDFALKFIPQ